MHNFDEQLTPGFRMYAYSANSGVLMMRCLNLTFLKCGSGYRKNIFVSWCLRKKFGRYFIAFVRKHQMLP